MGLSGALEHGDVASAGLDQDVEAPRLRAGDTQRVSALRSSKADNMVQKNR